ncbi:RING-H2 finger ATL43 -like protein [Gossypium arboreum]|uniref:RING-H2 finger ATL43-like protein n=1 Tax=Gossypium arboreum TaxID=29729 RepID=A0A0B0MP79_GOSAR|nr:RING-H2 finger ATL43 -like protein [Gossypium arboreum]
MPSTRYDAVCSGSQPEHDCSVCLTRFEPESEINRLSCGHLFHKERSAARRRSGLLLVSVRRFSNFPCTARLLYRVSEVVCSSHLCSVHPDFVMSPVFD